MGLKEVYLNSCDSMLVGKDMVFDFPSQHEGEKSLFFFIISLWGFFNKHRLKQALD